MPALFIITGSNGAGKSTVGHTYLPLEIQNKYTPFDGDKLAHAKKRELRKQIKSAKEAGRIADEWIEQHFRETIKKVLALNDHFVYEGHFRDDQSWRTPKKFKRNKYFLSLIFMGLSDPHQSELRVIERAKFGGHNVPLYEIEANFYGNLDKVNRNYKLFDELHIIDTSESLKHKVLLHLRQGEILSYVPSQQLPKWFIRFLPNLLKFIKDEESSEKDNNRLKS
jgi:predicted ABC-type ATPase